MLFIVIVVNPYCAIAPSHQTDVILGLHNALFFNVVMLLDLVEVCLLEGLFPPFASKITLPEERCQYVGALPVRTPGFFV